MAFSDAMKSTKPHSISCFTIWAHTVRPLPLSAINSSKTRQRVTSIPSFKYLASGTIVRWAVSRCNFVFAIILAREFNAMKKTPTDVFTNPRALAKLFKEAGRVKNVLSANANHYAQIEGLLDDKDFKFQVTREVFEEMCTDLFDRVAAPLHKALATAGLPLDVINQVILFGGGTRVPKIQEVLRTAIGQDLGKNINMDEAAAMGAVYLAADLATGFKVKKIVTKDATLFPIQVTFERLDSENGNVKMVKRSLFGPMNSYPQKKVITFNKHTEDFSFNVNYAELDHLSAEEIAYIGSLNLTRIRLTDVAAVIAANAVDETSESKGIKAHFVVDDSGILSVSSVEYVLEKTVTDADEESPLSKLGSTISKLFSSDKDADKETDKEEEATTTAPPEAGSSGENDEAAAGDATSPPPSSNSTSTNATDVPEEAAAAAAANKTEPKPKIVTVKKAITNTVELLFAVPLEGEQLTVARKKIDDLNELERETNRRESALNALESYVIEVNQRLDEKEYSSCATEAETKAIREACEAVNEWLYDDGEGAAAEAYEERLATLKKLTNDMYARHWEHSERPEATKTLKSLLESATAFHKNAQNFTKGVNEEKDVYTVVELETLEKTISETKTWLKSETDKQKKLARSVSVQLTVKSMTDKMALVDREVKYLVNKLKIWKPKVKKDKKKAAAAKNETATDEPNAEEAAAAAAAEEKSETVEKAEEEVIVDHATPATNEEEKIIPTETDDKIDPDHTEL